MAVEYPDEDEKQEEIYVKSFFFIAKNAPSINPDCNGKNVLQFNYRWPELHSMPPDNLCIDELVQIADGLYLGQLLYSVKAAIPCSPEKEPSAYQYTHFGYFMLMDNDWWSIKEFICFDTKSRRSQLYSDPHYALPKKTTQVFSTAFFFYFGLESKRYFMEAINIMEII